MAEQKKKTISSLVRLLTFVAILSGIAVITMVGFGMHDIAQDQVISIAEKDSVLISQLLINLEQEMLFSRNADGDSFLNIDSTYTAWLDIKMRKFLHPFDIVKIKIFDPDSTIVYSTDHAIIGKVDSKNTRLLRAMNGEVDSHLENKNEMRDITNESKFDVDVVETYLPIVVDGRVLGVFELYRDVSVFHGHIKDGTLKSIYLLAATLLFVYLIAFTVSKIGLNKAASAEAQLREQAMTDALTKTFNRGEIMSRAEVEVSRILRHGSAGASGQLSLIMLDIDHFKQVNDTHGHQAGDAVLCQLSDRIDNDLRPYDILGRYGGEEFLVLLPSTGLANAGIVAERIRSIVADTPFYFNDLSLDVTVSLGVSTFSGEISLAETIGQADQALYLAKESGRNRVETYEPIET